MGIRKSGLANCPLPAADCTRLLFLARHFLLSDGHAARAFSGARIGMRALASDGKTATVAQAAIAADVHQSLDVHLDLLAQIAFDHPLLVNDCADAINFVFGQFAYAALNADASFSENLVGARTPNTVDVRKTYFGSLVCRKVHT
jgi:hypothetical protein